MNKEQLAQQKADDMHLLRSFMQFLNDYVPMPQSLIESYGNYAMNIEGVIDRLKSGKEDAEREAVGFNEWCAENYKPIHINGKLSHWQKDYHVNRNPKYTTAQLYKLWQESKSQ